jgi:hypothetical protein
MTKQDAVMSRDGIPAPAQCGMSMESLGDEYDTPLYAFADLEDSDAIRLKQYKRDPQIRWRFPIPGHKCALIIIKPVYRRVTQQDRDTDNLVWRNHPGSHAFNFRHNIILVEPDQSVIGSVDHINHLVTIHGNQAQAKTVRDFYYLFAADPSAILALESERCCLCGKALTEPLSRSRGVGPECARKWNRLTRKGVEAQS